MDVQAHPRANLHPLVATAAVAVILASGVGIAAMTGLLPSGTAKQAEPALVAQVAPVAAAPVASPEPVVAAPEPAPVAKPAVKVAPKPKPVVVAKALAPVEPVQVAQAAVQLPAAYPAIPPDYRPPVEAQAPLPAPVQVAATKPPCMDCGIVESMREVEKKGEGTGVGAVAGGMGGLILGHQMGNGTGNKIATVLGAVGGAFAGHQLEKNARTTKSYEIGVRMADGGYRTIASSYPPTWRAGDHVRVVNGVLQSDAH